MWRGVSLLKVYVTWRSNICQSCALAYNSSRDTPDWGSGLRSCLAAWRCERDREEVGGPPAPREEQEVPSVQVHRTP